MTRSATSSSLIFVITLNILYKKRITTIKHATNTHMVARSIICSLDVLLQRICAASADAVVDLFLDMTTASFPLSKASRIIVEYPKSQLRVSLKTDFSMIFLNMVRLVKLISNFTDSNTPSKPSDFMYQKSSTENVSAAGIPSTTVLFSIVMPKCWYR